MWHNIEKKNSSLRKNLGILEDLSNSLRKTRKEKIEISSKK